MYTTYSIIDCHLLLVQVLHSFSLYVVISFQILVQYM